MPYILTKNIRKIAQDWEKWKDTTVRPLPEHEEIYEKHFKKIARRKNPRILILGSTPELRTLAHKYKFEVTCVDHSLLMYQAMSLLVRGDIEKETFVRADWRELPLPDNYYDLIAGDDVLTVLFWRDWGKMLKKLHSLLKPNGFVSTHLIVKFPDSWVCEDIVNVFEKYKMGKIKTEQDFLVQAAATMWDSKTYQFSWQRFLEKVKKLKEDGEIRSDFGILNKYKHFAGVSTLPPKDEFEKLAKTHFKIVSISYVQKFEYCKFEPVYFLKKI